MIKIADVQRVVSETYSMSVSDLIAPCLRRHRSHPRQVAMYLARELTGKSLPNIGARFGGRDHTTVWHACRMVEQRCREDAELRAHVEDLRRVLGQPT